MKYKILKVSMINYKLYYEGKEIDSYIDLINKYSKYGYSLSQVLSLPSEDTSTQLTLDIILQRDDSTSPYNQGFPY
ncbi:MULTISPECIES: hypothetical protein [Clostridium]|uniref:hypothetical protein n=1 Tax=Clostridium TaxID=1485 RepID=UPI0018993638|nr:MULTISPECIES: hypothetical protein [Clostridium]MDI9218222.1 hypothetical protein [Clostridium tertium]